MEIRLYLPVILMVAGFMPVTTHATQLTGLLTIDAGYKAPKEVAPDLFADLYQGGSYFAMGANNPNGNAAMLSPGTAGGIQLDSFQNFVTDPDEPHPEGHPDATFGAGSGYNALVSESSVFSAFSFFGNPTYIGINPVSYQSGVTKNAPTLDMISGSCVSNVCDIEVDFSAWEVYWNGSVFEQGPRPDNTLPFGLATGTVDTVTGNYALDWSSQILGGPFSGVTGFWHIEGQFTNVSAVSTVPVTAAVWLFGSGLVGLLSMARRKKGNK